jgi:hypothetical protein
LLIGNRQSLFGQSKRSTVSGLIPKHKEEATDDIREKGERG